MRWCVRLWSDGSTLTQAHTHAQHAHARTHARTGTHTHHAPRTCTYVHMYIVHRTYVPRAMYLYEVHARHVCRQALDSILFSMCVGNSFLQLFQLQLSRKEQPQSTVHSPQSTVHSPQSTVHSPQYLLRARLRLVTQGRRTMYIVHTSSVLIDSGSVVRGCTAGSKYYVLCTY